MSTFAELTTRYREKKGMRQKFLAEQVGLHPTQLNHIEKGRVTRLEPAIVVKIANILALSDVERYEYIEAAGYDPHTLEEEPENAEVKAVSENFLTGGQLPSETKQKKRNLPEPPPIGEKGAKDKLNERIPAWRLKGDGTITHANLLAFWIWNALIEEVLYPDTIIGQNAFEVYTANIERIAMPKTARDFWYVKMFMFVIVVQYMSKKVFNNIIDKIMKYPLLKLLYEYAYNHPEEEPVGKDYYEYYLELTLPQDLYERNADTQASRLTFRVSLRVLRDEAGNLTDFIASYIPLDDFTKKIIFEKHKELSERKRYDYIQSATVGERAYAY